MSMKAIAVGGAGKGGPELLYVADVPKPELKPKHLLIHIKATALNRADTLQREGKYPPPPGESEVMGLEMAGVVETVGPDASSSFKPGDRVCALLGGGGYAEYCVIHEDMAMRIPDTLSFEQAAAVPEAFLTAYQALVWNAHLPLDHPVDEEKKDTNLNNKKVVLIHAGASGVGTAAIQLVKQQHQHQHRVIVTASTEKLAQCRALGADEAVDRTANGGRWVDQVMELTSSSGGVDVIIDFVGSPYWEQNLEALAPDGTMVMLAFLGGSKLGGEGATDLAPILRKRLTIRGSTLRARSLEYKIKLTKEFEAHAMDKFRDGQMKALVTNIFSWEKVGDAHRFMESNQSVGKIVLNGM